MKPKTLGFSFTNFGFAAALLSVVTGLGTTACQTSPTGRHQLVLMSEDEVEKSGVTAFQDLKTKEPIDRSATDNVYVKCIADAITQTLENKQTWEVVVFQSDEVNAFALPGGKIGVYTGLLKVATTPEQVAAVLGHEVGHVVAQHGRERISTQLATQGALSLTSALLQVKGSENYQVVMGALGLGTQFGVLLPFSRTQESEADVIGLQNMARAGFDPHQALTLWENMSKSGGAQPPVLLSDHPSNSQRIENLQKHMPEAVALYNAASSRPHCAR